MFIVLGVVDRGRDIDGVTLVFCCIIKPVPRPQRRAAMPRNGGTGMQYTLAAAARAAGRDKTTLLRAIKKGAITAERHPTTGGWMIEGAELHRVYPAAAAAAAAMTRNGNAAGHNGTDSAEMAVRLAVAEAELRLKDELIAELRRSVALLSDRREQQQQQPAAPQAPPPHRGWWRRLMG